MAKIIVIENFLIELFDYYSALEAIFGDTKIQILENIKLLYFILS